jgi:hypothetical protein
LAKGCKIKSTKEHFERWYLQIDWKSCPGLDAIERMGFARGCLEEGFLEALESRGKGD